MLMANAYCIMLCSLVTVRNSAEAGIIYIIAYRIPWQQGLIAARTLHTI